MAWFFGKGKTNNKHLDKREEKLLKLQVKEREKEINDIQKRLRRAVNYIDKNKRAEQTKLNEIRDRIEYIILRIDKGEVSQTDFIDYRNAVTMVYEDIKNLRSIARHKDLQDEILEKITTKLLRFIEKPSSKISKMSKKKFTPAL